MCNVGDILLGIHTQLCCPVDDNAVGLRVEHTVYRLRRNRGQEE